MQRSASSPAGTPSGSLADLDRQLIWHPFTQMREWMASDPVIIVEGRGAVLRDANGREYLDANASIWTNLHGHRHPAIDAALRRQLGKIAHSSFLGLSNEPAILLARELIRMANPTRGSTADDTSSAAPSEALVPRLTRVFYSDNGSTALEVSLKLAYEFSRRVRGMAVPRFLSMQGAYHGDTIGAVSLGHIDRFHAAFRGLLFRSDAVMAPYCYRCPYNRAAPERSDARQYRRCQWECVGEVERAFDKARHEGQPYAAMVYEPRIQGAAGMIPQPDGWLFRVAAIARAHDALLIADEVLTGLGRGGTAPASSATLAASHAENVQPDFLNLAKGLAGGYLPLATTLTTDAVFDAFLGEYEEFKTFFHGHSFTGNPLGCAAALAGLELLETHHDSPHRARLERLLSDELRVLWQLPHVGDVRQVGLVAGVELVRDWRTRTPFQPGERAGTRVCNAMRERGVLTRPIGDVVVIMPPYCTTPAQLRRMVTALAEAIEEVTQGQPGNSSSTLPNP